MTEYDGVAFTYDGRGRRTGKGNISFTYSSGGKLIAQSNGIEFFYDAGGVAGLVYNDTTYLVRRDAQGNVSALLDGSGNVVVQYTYDAWGRHSVTAPDGSAITDPAHIGNVNPIRYRGYYYDTETHLYFLQTRYYDPETGRFVTIDGIEYADPETLNGLNLYAYCCNNPVMLADPTGTSALLAFLIGAVVVGISTLAGAVSGGINAAINEQDFWKGFGAGAIGGLVGGAVSLIPIPAPFNVILGRVANSAVYGILNELFQTGTLANMNWGMYAADIIVDSAFSMLYVGWINDIAVKIGKSLTDIVSTAISGFIEMIIDLIESIIFSDGGKRSARLRKYA